MKFVLKTVKVTASGQADSLLISAVVALFILATSVVNAREVGDRIHSASENGGMVLSADSGSSPLCQKKSPMDMRRGLDDFPTLEKIDRAISGADSVAVNGVRTIIRTRYAYSESKKLAFDYLTDLISNHMHCDLRSQDFVLRVERPDLWASVLSASGDTLWLGSIEGKIYRCTDPLAENLHFSELTGIEQKIFDLTLDKMGRLWAACCLLGGGLGALFVSDDGGYTWVEHANSSKVYSLKSIVFGNENFGMAAGSYGTVIRTADGGDYWSIVDPGNFSYHSITGVAATSPLSYWLISYFGEVYETSDIGTSWSVKSLPVFPTYAIDFYGSDYGVIVGDNVVYYTKDAGADWHEVDIDAELRKVCMVDSELVVAADIGGTLWRSENGGASWDSLLSICHSKQDVRDITPLGGGRFVLTGDNVVKRLSLDQSGGCDTFALADTIMGKNIIFDHRGESEPNDVIVVCAHYDAISKTDPMVCAPGADDNGSGVITVLHTAHVLDTVRTKKTIEFVLFDGEEVGLRGSRYFTSYLDTDRVYRCAINVDMIGYNADGNNSLTIVGREGSRDDSLLVEGFIAAADSIHSDITCDPLAGASYASDHYSFWDVDVSAILLIEGRRGEWTPYYHSCNDTYDHVDFNFVDKCRAVTTRLVLDLAGVAEPSEEPHPAAPVLYTNYPNPFSIGTIITYALPRPSFVKLAVYDILGRRIALLDKGYRQASAVHIIRWDGKSSSGKKLAEGVYFLRLDSQFGEASKKIVLVH